MENLIAYWACLIIAHQWFLSTDKTKMSQIVMPIIWFAIAISALLQHHFK